MSINSVDSMSIFDFVDDIDAFIDEWYGFHEEVYRESVPLQSFHKKEYLTLNFEMVSVEEEYETTKPVINVIKALKDINQKTPLGFGMIDFSPVFLREGILDGQFGNEDTFKEAA